MFFAQSFSLSGKKKLKYLDKTGEKNEKNVQVHSNNILYSKQGEHPDHVVVIKYVPAVGDSKRAMDEYTSEIFMVSRTFFFQFFFPSFFPTEKFQPHTHTKKQGGKSTIVMHNTCEDSLLAAPIILDLVIVAELLTRISLREEGRDDDFRAMHPVAALLSYLTKAPLVPEGAPVVNALASQRAALENVLRACCGLPADNHMLLEFK